MLKSLLSNITQPKTRYLAMTVGGMGALLIGRRMTGASLFVSGLVGLEKQWREDNQFSGTWAERWEHSLRFYESTHANETNRVLHMAGIPIIVASTVGLLAFRAPNPLWFASIAGFVGGWGLNFVGHGIYEKNAPAFQDDPLSFFAGPVWDLQEFRKMRQPDASADAAE